MFKTLGLGLILKGKYKLIQKHHDRLRTEPRPDRALKLFNLRMKQTKRMLKIRLVCFIVLYASALVAVASAIAQAVGSLGGIEGVVQAIASASTGLTGFALVGILVVGKWLSNADVDLSYYSTECRMKGSRRR